MNDHHYISGLLDDVQKELANAGTAGASIRGQQLVQRVKDARSHLRASSQRQGVGHAQSAEIFKPRPDRILRVKGTAQIAAAGSLINLPVQWPTRARVFGVCFGVIEGTAAALAALTVRIVTEGASDLFTDGFGGAFAHMGSMVVPGALSNVGFYPLDIEVDQGVAWQVSINNESVGTAATPVIQFAYLECR